MPLLNHLVTTNHRFVSSHIVNALNGTSLKKSRLQRITIPKETSAFTEQVKVNEMIIAGSTRINPPELPINNAALRYGIGADDRWWDETTDKPDSSSDSFSLPLTLTNGQKVTYHRVAASKPGGLKSLAIETEDGQWQPINRVRPDLLPFFNQEVIKTLDTNQRIVICEGVPAAQALIDKDIKAIGTLSGVIVPEDSVLEPLVDKEIVLWPDNDDVGVHFMALMTLALKRLGAKNIKLIQWSEGPFRGDAANFSGNKTKLMTTTVLIQASKFIYLILC